MSRNPFRILSRGKNWKAHVDRTLSALSDSSTAAALDLGQIRQMLQKRAGFSAETFRTRLRVTHPDGAKLSDTKTILFARRSSDLLLLPMQADQAPGTYAGLSLDKLVIAAVQGALTQAIILEADAPSHEGNVAGPVAPGFLVAPWLIELIKCYPDGAMDWMDACQPTLAETTADDKAAGARPLGLPLPSLTSIQENLHLIDFVANGVHSPQRGLAPRPFDQPEHLPPYLPAEPKRRSVLFSNHCYYNFQYLAKALRARGWDAVCLGTEAPDNADRRFYHGEDLTIFDPDIMRHEQLLNRFMADNADRFGIFHSYGVGALSLFASNRDYDSRFLQIPWDILELKRRGVLIGYSHSGCLDGVSQSSFRGWNRIMCGVCVWENNPDVCSDARNLAWGEKLTGIVDLFCTETDPPLDFKGSPNAFRAPLTFALDPQVWHPDIQPPEHLVRARRDGEIIVYHAVGNYSLRTKEGRNVKGTGAVLAAIESLQSEGLDIRLDFVDNLTSNENRFVQAQADIIVDQLNYGRYGATAREGLMLGKPVVGRVDLSDGDGLPATRCILDTTIVHADETSIADVLRDLALNPNKRREIGAASREYAVHWWSAERLAGRFEYVYDHIRNHGRPPAEEDVP